MASQSKSTWDKTKAMSNTFFQKVGAPVNKLSNKLGAEAFWPASLDQESDKAARILRSFCIDGFAAEQGGGQHGHDKKHEKSLDRIPPEVSSTCKDRRLQPSLLSILDDAETGSRSSATPAASPSSPSCVRVYTGPARAAAASSFPDCPTANGRHPQAS